MAATRPKLTEKAFQRQVVQLAAHCAWELYHTFDSRRSQPGFPDLVLAHTKRGLLFVELKTDTGKLSKEQDRWRLVLLRAGADARVWRPRDWPEIQATLTGDVTPLRATI